MLAWNWRRARWRVWHVAQLDYIIVRGDYNIIIRKDYLIVREDYIIIIIREDYPIARRAIPATVLSSSFLQAWQQVCRIFLIS